LPESLNEEYWSWSWSEKEEEVVMMAGDAEMTGEDSAVTWTAVLLGDTVVVVVVVVFIEET